MREKLIELMLQTYTFADQYELPARKQAEYVADHLLADEEIKHAFELLKAEKEGRMIVPPFKCGDRVWFVLEGLGEVCEATVIKYEYNYFTSPQEWLTIEYISAFIGKHKYESRIDLMLGKTVFLSKEDAEKALKEAE